MNFLRKIWNSLHKEPPAITNDEMQYAGSADASPTPNPCLGVAAPTLMPESTKDGEKLTGREMERMRQFLPTKLVCPDCMMDSLHDGPSGGGSQNVYCLNKECLSKFNDGIGWSRISDKQPAKKFEALAKVVTELKFESPDDDNFELRGNL